MYIYIYRYNSIVVPEFVLCTCQNFFPYLLQIFRLRQLLKMNTYLPHCQLFNRTFKGEADGYYGRAWAHQDIRHDTRFLVQMMHSRLRTSARDYVHDV